MSRKILRAAVCCLAVCVFCGCSAQGGEDNEATGENILFDTTFSAGIKISGLESQSVSYTWWQYGQSTTATPYWSLGQYCNLANTREGYDSEVNDLSLGSEVLDIDAKGIMGQDGDYYTLTNQSGSKYIAVNTGTGEVILTVDTSKEYVDQATGEISPRTSGEDWVHMILEQNPGTVYLDQVEAVYIELDFTITEETIYDTSIGAEQFQWIFTVSDKASVTDDYFWFNVTLYDNRYDVYPGIGGYDSGKADSTGKYIYAPSGYDLFGDSASRIEVGTEYHIKLDLKSYIKTAFETAQANGALTDAKWENLAINSFNLGWEVSNVSKVGVSIKNLALTVVE